MLKGEFIYKTHKYKLNAVDSSDYMNLYMRSHNADDIAFMGDNTEDTLDERKIQISQTKITVETPINVVNNKKVKAPVNKELFTKLGVLIRYAKQNCHTKNEEGYTGLKIASGEFLAKPKKTYIIPYPKEPTKQLARVVLYYGDILELDLNTDDISIHLEEDISSKPRLFGKPKDGIQLGFKFDYEHLGFEQNQKTISNNLVDGVFYNSIEEIIEANPHKEFRWLLQKNYILVTDDILEDTVKYILDHNGLVYYDTETTGLNINFYSREGKADQLVGVVLSVKYGESFFFPCQMNSIPNLCGGDHHYFMEYYMRPILEGKDIVCHNAPFDWKVAYIYGINTNVVHDTMAILHLTFGAEYKNFKVGLKPSTKLLLNRDSLELSNLVRNNSWGEVEVTFADLPPELVKLYACADTDNTNGLMGYATQNNLLAKYNATKVYEIEILFGLAVAYQEFYGHRLDINNIKELRAEIEHGQAEEMAKMEAIVGHSFNPNSSPQLLKIMYKELGIPEQTSRKTGNPTTDKDTLKKLSEYEDIDGNKKYPFVSHLLKYREYEGVRKIIDKAPEYMTEEGYLFSEVQQYGTTTGRVSIKEPNYQSYNDPVKKNIIPRPGFWMFDTDYSSVEYRVLGNMVGNKRIMTSFQDPDFDYHAYQASHMYGVPYSAVTKKLRKAAKGINFGLPYGMGDPSLGAQIFGEVSDENTKQAAKLREAYFKGQEDIKDWFETNRDLGVNRGYTETYFGRRRYYRKEDFSESAIRRQAGNQIIQGSSADIYKLAVGRVFRRICKEGWLGKVMLTAFVHDELLGEVSDEINPAVWLKILREEFEVQVYNDDGSPWCPLYMGFGYGMNWYDAKTIELPIKLQWELVKLYGDNGFPDWNGDGATFFKKIPDMLRNFEVRDIRQQLLDPSNQGKEIKPTLNNQLLDCCKYDIKHIPKAVAEYGDREGLLEHLDREYHIQNVIRGTDGSIITDLSLETDTQKAIDMFCKLHNVDRFKVDILNISDVEVNVRNTNAFEVPDEYIDYDTEDEDKKAALKAQRIAYLGYYIDIDTKEITLRFEDNKVLNDEIKKLCTPNGDYAVFFKDIYGVVGQKVKDMVYPTQARLPSNRINSLSNLYSMVQYKG